MDSTLFTIAGVEYLFRWVHFLAGITWIGLLYYFNFVQGEWFKEAAADTKSQAIQQLVPRALWWFRWGAMFTFLTGAGMLYFRGAGVSVDIAVGAILGTLMFLNVWLIIWPKQQVVIESAKQAANGGKALPEAAAALARAGVASRTNVLFSIPMLFFMGSSAHLFHGLARDVGLVTWIALGIIIGLIQFNAMKGKPGPMASVSGVIHFGILLTVVLFAVVEWL